MKTGLQLHMRDRDVFECEAFERSTGKIQVIIKKGYLSGASSSNVAVVVIPSANKTFHHFPILEPLGDGYAYEGDFGAVRGWRVRIEHITPKE